MILRRYRGYTAYEHLVPIENNYNPIICHISYLRMVIRTQEKKNDTLMEILCVAN